MTFAKPSSLSTPAISHQNYVLSLAIPESYAPIHTKAGPVQADILKLEYTGHSQDYYLKGLAICHDDRGERVDVDVLPRDSFNPEPRPVWLDALLVKYQPHGWNLTEGAHPTGTLDRS
uniref:hypothetical protein n=1 Tax=Kitasatospora sp. NBC_01519 TaxID=2903576 RepID=UPI002F90A639